MTNYDGEERRTNGGLTEKQIDEIRDAILRSIYEEIGRSVVKKVLWTLGAVLSALLVWAGYKGYLPPR